MRTKKGNPWMEILCEECNQQLLSYKKLGLASFFDKDDDDPWRTGLNPDVIKRYVCVRCSNKLGYDDE
jgi:hypothetical protein